jgi:hypothetical protein
MLIRIQEECGANIVRKLAVETFTVSSIIVMILMNVLGTMRKIKAMRMCLVYMTHQQIVLSLLTFSY